MNLEGEIGDVDVVGRLVELGREQFTGAIRYESDGIIKIIYFKSGDVLSASTNDRSDSIDEILLRAGKITREHIKQALAKRKETETLGDALLNLGFITRKELTWARRVQVIGIIRSISTWKSGTYTIVADYLPKREEGTLFPLSQIIVELIVTEQDRPRFEQALDGGNAVYQKAGAFDAEFSRLGLNQDAEEIARQIDGVRTAAEVAATSGKEVFNVYKLLHALSLLGLLIRGDVPYKPQVVDELPFGDAADFASVGVADAADLWSDEPLSAQAATVSIERPLATPSMEFPPMAETIVSTPLPLASQPAWDEPAILPQAFPVDPEPAWGFDDAQIETARTMALASSAVHLEPEPPPMADVVQRAARPNRVVGALLVSVVIVLVAFGSYTAWNWWQSRKAAAAVTATTPLVRTSQPAANLAVPAVAPAGSSTVAPSTGLSTQPVGLSITPSTTTVVPSNAATPSVTTAAASVPPPVAPVPVVATTTSRPVTVRPTLTNGAKPVAVTPAPSAFGSTPSGTRVEHRVNGGAVITNSGAPAATPRPAPITGTPDAARARYDEMARNFQASATGNYTIQFELVCQTASLAKAVSAGGSDVWFVPTAYRGGTCYRVFWGHYQQQSEAERGVAAVPSALRGGATPVVVHIPK